MRNLFSSLRIRLILLVLLALVPALGLMFYTVYEDWRLATTRIQEDTLRLSKLAASNLEQAIEGTRQLLNSLPWLPYVHLHQSKPALCNELFANLMKQYSYYNNFGAVNSQGNVYCSALPFKSPLNVANYPWFQQAAQTHTFAVGEYQRRLITGKPGLYFGYPILDKKDHLKAVVFADMDLSWLYQLMSRVQLPPGAEVSVTDRQGRILAHYPYEEKMLGQAMPESQLVKIMSAQREGTVEIKGEDGEPHLYAFTSLGKASKGDIFVCISIPKKLVYAKQAQIFTRSMMALGLIAVLVLVITWVSGNFLFLRPVKTLVKATDLLRSGDLKVRTGSASGPGELRQLAQAFDEMAGALEQRAAEREKAEEALRESEKELRFLSTQLLMAQENERKRIAQELHDGLGQFLNAIKFKVEHFLQQTDETKAEGKTQPMTAIIPMIQEAVEEVRRIYMDLRPSTLDDLGILATMTWFCREFQKTYPGILIEQEINLQEKEVPALLKIVIYRVLQEAFKNIAKHSQADRVRLSLKKMDNTIELLIEDNGQGFDLKEVLSVENSQRGLGIASMKERVELSGGSFTIGSFKEVGTGVIAIWPFSTSEEL